MYVTPKVKEQFAWKFSSLVGTLDLKQAALGVLIWLLKPGVHFPPECDPRQLHPLLYESFFLLAKKPCNIEIFVTVCVYGTCHTYFCVLCLKEHFSELK